MIEKNFYDMQDYFTAIIKISESSNEETLKAIKRVAIDASNYFTDNFAPGHETAVTRIYNEKNNA